MWRSDVEMLEVVRTRAAVVQRRRRIGGTGTAAAVVLVAAVALAVTRQAGGTGSQQVRVAGVPGTTSAGLRGPNAVAGLRGPNAMDGPSSGLLTRVDPPTTAAAVPTTVLLSQPATTVGHATTTAVPATVAPTVAATPVPTTSPPVSTTAALPPTCLPSEVMATTALDKERYLPGQPVRVTATVRNTSSRPCGEPSFGWTVEVRDQSGARLWGLGLSATNECAGPDDCVFKPGDVHTVTPCWDQRQDVTTPASQVPTGVYTLRVGWMGPVTTSASTAVQIVPDPAAPTTTVPLTHC